MPGVMEGLWVRQRQDPILIFKGLFCPLHTLLESKRPTMTGGEDMAEMQPSAKAGGNVKWCSLLEDSLGAPEKVTHSVAA